MSDLRVQFGRRLKALRIEREMTQEDLANAADVSTVFISSIERGKYAPSFDNLQKLAKALGVSVKDLFDFADVGASEGKRVRLRR
jgi:transcriptional regulator with XRE-family HTH domain